MNLLKMASMNHRDVKVLESSTRLSHYPPSNKSLISNNKYAKIK